MLLFGTLAKRLLGTLNKLNAEQQLYFPVAVFQPDKLSDSTVPVHLAQVIGNVRKAPDITLFSFNTF